MGWQAVLFKYRNGQIWQDECWFGEKPSCHFSCSRSTILMLIMLASFWWSFMSRRVVVMLPDRLVRCVLLIIFSLKLMILVCCWYTLQSDLHHELTAAEGCKENLRNRQGVGAIFFFFFINVSLYKLPPEPGDQKQVQRCRQCGDLPEKIQPMIDTIFHYTACT